MKQSPNMLEVVLNTSLKMLKSSGHFLHVKMVAEQRASEIVRLQEIVTAHTKEKNNLKVEIKTLK